MDVKNINPFIQAFETVMPQLGFNSVKVGSLELKGSEIVSSGIIIIVGIVGEIKGNVVYAIHVEDAKTIASTMMMGMPVSEIDAMAKSALSELTNMLTANAATCFSNNGVMVDISTPTLLHGDDISVKMGADKALCVQLLASEVTIHLNIAFQN